MAEGSSLKLIMEKGPREGETLKYSSGSVVKVGRVVRGNTIAIKDAGISSNHIRLQFDNELSKWTLCDLDSSNGTLLNGQILQPHVPSGLEDGDFIKIGELTSIIVKIGADSPIRLRRNPRRQGKHESGAGVAAVGEKGTAEVELGFDGDLGGNEVKQPVEKRNLRSRGRKTVDLKNEVESLSSRRILRSSKKEEVSFSSKLNQIPENLNVDAVEITDCYVSIEPKRTRGRKKMSVQLPEGPGLDQRKPAEIVVPVDGKRTRRGRKVLRVEPLEENLNNANGSLQVVEENEATFDELLKDSMENVKNSTLGNDLETNNESAQEHVVDGSLLKGKEVAEVSEECRKDSCEAIAKDTGADNGRWLDLEKMTLSDFFDYMEVQLAKEIYDESEKVISDLKEKARKCHEFRLQRNEIEKGN